MTGGRVQPWSARNHPDTRAASGERKRRERMLSCRRSRLRATLAAGKAEGFPLCCRIRYALEEQLLGRYDQRRETGQCARRGVRFTEAEIEYVPCNLFHRARLTHREYELLLARIEPPW